MPQSQKPLAKRQDDHHLVVSNYNTDPTSVVERYEHFTIFDQSQDPSFANLVHEQFPGSVRAPHVGHNLGDYFAFIDTNWNSLPEVLVLAKGNLVGRHVTQEFFDRVYANDFYTPLYCDPQVQLQRGVSSLITSNAYLERNTSWYMQSRPGCFFNSFGSALEFFFKDPVHPEWVEFAPGGCYIVPRNHISRYPRDFFKTLHYLVTYKFFPAEAFLVERLLHTVWTANYDLTPNATSLETALAHLDNLAQDSANGRFGPKGATKLTSLKRRLNDAYGVLVHRVEA